MPFPMPILLSDGSTGRTARQLKAMSKKLLNDALFSIDIWIFVHLLFIWVCQIPSVNPHIADMM